ncbi:hypothetical protein P4H39_30560 [Paenibacillus lautus]|uniref:hypothetical protein n=1 Tax=Paenibacillus lautus TaxID=1401 RepID=UPI002DB6D7A6|nr:hypothetical protein [Paenibacillus lautus]MEC0206958.1 hypothetical protein [Paenibacillus lautus]
MSYPLNHRVLAMWLSCTIPSIMKRHTGCAWVVWNRKFFHRRRLVLGLRQAAVARADLAVMRIIAQTAVVHLEVPDLSPILLAALPAAHPVAVVEINGGGEVNLLLEGREVPFLYQNGWAMKDVSYRRKV